MTNLGIPQPFDAALRRKLDKLRTSGPTVHHVADMASGKVASERVRGPLTPAVRSQRLARFGHLFDGSIFGGPTYRLSSRETFQESPLAWFAASSVTQFVTEVEFIGWSQARDPESNGFLHFHFEEPPPGKCLASLSISAFPHAGTTGSITLRAHGSTVRIPVTQSINHVIEIVFQPPASGPADLVMILEDGVQVAAFFFMTLGPAPLVLTPD